MAKLGTGYRPDPSHVVAARDPGAFARFTAPRLVGVGTYPMATRNRDSIPLSKGGPGIWNQVSLSGCTGMASGGAGTARFAIAGTPLPEALSPIGPYKLGRGIDRTPNDDGTYPALVDEGAEPTQVIRAAMTFGMASLSGWGEFPPANPATINVEATAAQLEAAGEFVLGGAYFLPNDDTGARILGIIRACTLGEPLTGSIAASGNAFEGYSGGILTASQLTGPLDHYTYTIDHAWTGSSADWATFVSALQNGDTSIWTPMLPSFTTFDVNSWDVSWGWSDVAGLSGGFYQIDGSAIAQRSDQAVWEIEQGPST